MNGIFFLVRKSRNGASRRARRVKRCSACAVLLTFPARMCLKLQFLFNWTAAVASKISCGIVCVTRGPKCLGFRLKGSSGCQTFEFDKCSHTVNEANCTNFEWVYLRKLNDLPLGQLCPDGFGNGYYGSVYKMIDIGSWTQALGYCSSLPGLTKFADGFDKAEVDHFHTLKAALNGFLVNSMRSFYVGGHRIGDSVTGTWFWEACNATFAPEVWDSGQPNEGDSHDRSNVWYSHVIGIDDEVESAGYLIRALCECVNPFV